LTIPRDAGISDITAMTGGTIKYQTLNADAVDANEQSEGGKNPFS